MFTTDVSIGQSWMDLTPRWIQRAGCSVAWLPEGTDFQHALTRLGFRLPAPRTSPRDVQSIPPGSPVQAALADTLRGATPQTCPSPMMGGSAQRPRRGKRGTGERAAAAPAAPPLPLHNLRLLLRSMAAVLRRVKVCLLVVRAGAIQMGLKDAMANSACL